MTGRAAIFGNTASKSPDSERLLELYWNRAELKKEFANLRKEQFRLKDRIRDQEGAAARLQQKLEHLESLLLDPEWVHSVGVFYQLRALNIKCQRKLARFAEQLKQQREQRQHGRVMAAWNEQRGDETRSIEHKLGKIRAERQQLEDRREAERHRLASLSGLFRFFKRRRIARDVDSLSEQIAERSQVEDNLTAELVAVRERQPPEQQGLDVAAKRSINFMILAFAQQLYLHFNDNALAGLAKEAADKSIGSVNYGGRQECAKLLMRIADKNRAFDNVGDFADLLQRRAKLLAECAMYCGDEEAVPVPGTVSTLFAFSDSGQVERRDVNLLGEDYWGLSQVMSR